MWLAQITPRHHTKTQTCFENHNLIRHWITSFQLLNMKGMWAALAGLSRDGAVTNVVNRERREIHARAFLGLLRS